MKQLQKKKNFPKGKKKITRKKWKKKEEKEGKKIFDVLKHVLNRLLLIIALVEWTKRIRRNAETDRPMPNQIEEEDHPLHTRLQEEQTNIALTRTGSNPSVKSTKSQPSKHSISEIRLYNGLIHFLRVLFSTIYLIYIVLTIPLSFEVGGLNCGLSYSLTILILYFCLATLRVLKYHRFISSFLYYLQHLFLPTLLSYFLTLFKNEQPLGPANHLSTSSIFQNIWWNYIIKFWKFFLINSTPLFTILEGFCSLLSVQAIGQLFKYFIRNKSDTWSILNLVLSSCILSTSIYFAGKIYVSPLIDLENVGLITASLLGSAFTLTILITFYAIYYNRATTLESSLMVAYIVKCCYELFPELSKTNISSLFRFVFNEFKKIDNQAKQSLTLNKEHINFSKIYIYLKLDEISRLWSHYWNDEELVSSNIRSKVPQILNVILEFVTTIENFGKVLFNLVLEHFPKSFGPLWDFFKLSIGNLTFSILIQLAYRITVFFAATKIIPILSPMNNISPVQIRKEQQSTSSRLIYLYSPCIIIAVYTNLMIQYNYEIEKETHLFLWLHNKFSEFFSSDASALQNQLSSATTNSITNILTSTGTFKTVETTVSNSSSSISSLFMSIHSWQFWNWINIFAVLLLYFSELVSYDPEDSSLTDHWN